MVNVYRIIFRRLVSALEIIFGLIIGILFLGVGIISFLPPHYGKLPYLIRLIIFLIGFGFIIFSVSRILGIAYLK